MQDDLRWKVWYNDWAIGLECVWHGKKGWVGASVSCRCAMYCC